MGFKFMSLDELARLWSHKPLQHAIIQRNIAKKK